MKIPAGVNPAKICSKDENRYAIEHALVAGGHLVATDGRRMMIQAVVLENGDDSSPALIHRDALESAYDAAELGSDSEDNVVRVESKVKIGTAAVEVEISKNLTATHPRREKEISFPKWTASLPEKRGPGRLLFNARMLAELVEAMGLPGDRACLEFDPAKPCSPIIVTCGERPSIFGVLMPLRNNDDGSPNTAWDFFQKSKVNNQGQLRRENDHE